MSTGNNQPKPAVTGNYPGGLSVGPNSFPTPPATQNAQAGKRLNSLTKLNPKPLRVDVYNQAIYQGVNKGKNKKVLVIILVLAIVIFHKQLLGEK